jgi:squalene-hopene/tetraprenyl-beta-curcumene cyclase
MKLRGPQLAVLLAISASAQTLHEPLDESLQREGQSALGRGVAYLVNEQKRNGSWGDDLGATAFCLYALELSRASVKKSTKALAAGFVITRAAKLDTLEVADRVYAVSAAILALSAHSAEKHAGVIATLHDQLLKSQPQLWARQTATYGNQDRHAYITDVHWVLEACAAVELPAIVSGRAAQFLSDCQIIDDSLGDSFTGAFAYSPSALKSKPPHRIWAQGSFTAAGIKSLLFCNVPTDDSRIQLGLEWLARYPKPVENPKAGSAGYYSYLYLLSTMNRMLQAQAAVPVRHRHMQRAICEEVLARQRGAGNWESDSILWREGDRNLCTAYAIIALSLTLE